MPFHNLGQCNAPQHAVSRNHTRPKIINGFKHLYIYIYIICIGTYLNQRRYVKIDAAQAILHAHPTFCTALAVHRKPIPAFHYMIGVAGGKTIPCTDYATFGSQELSDSIIDSLKVEGGGHLRACLLANHGMICHASSIHKTVGLALEVECLAQQYIHASTLGEPIILDDAEMDIILAKFKTYGKQKAEIAEMSNFNKVHAVIPPPQRPGSPPSAVSFGASGDAAGAGAGAAAAAASNSTEDAPKNTKKKVLGRYGE